MATVYIYTSLNMQTTGVYYGTVLESTASEIAISNGTYQTIYLGNFTYDAAGVHGVLTTVYSYVNGQVTWIAEGLNTDAATAYYDIQILGSAQALFQSALAGNDQFVIGAFGTHVLNGYGGYNTLTEIGPRYDYIANPNGNGGTGVGEHDTFTNIQGVYFSDGFLNWTTGVFYPLAPTGQTIIFQHPTGPIVQWQVNGAGGLINGTLVGNLGAGWHVKGSGHFFFGDGATDLVSQNNNGAIYLTQMDGNVAFGGGQVASDPGPSWHVEGIADFYLDGRSDVLFQNVNGQVAFWDMNGTSVLDGAVIAYNPGPTWHVEGTADFYHDGHAGILFQNNNGQIAIWEMSGANIVNGGVVAYDPGPSWHIAGTGDFYGNGNSDILWQNDNGAIALWGMNGITPVVGNVISVNPGPSWHVEATGDFNGDGITDIAWQNDNGQVAVWDMNGASIINGGVVTYNPGTYQVVNDRMQFIVSGAAGETIAATPSPDTFIFTSPASGAHTVIGFNPAQDMVELSAAHFESSFAQVQAATTATAGGSLIDLGNASLLLAGVSVGALHAADVTFA